MKFGKELEKISNGKWCNYYIQYKRLKRLLKRIAFEKKEIKDSIASHEKSPLVGEKSTNAIDVKNEASVAFWESIDENLKIVNSFYHSRIVSLRGALDDLKQNLNGPSHGHVHTVPVKRNSGFARLQEIYNELVDLRTFVQINYSGFRKIVKKVSMHTLDESYILYT